MIQPNAIYVFFVSDGRFHLESALIQNPSVVFYRYDPFTKNLLRESYAHDKMHSNRRDAIIKARKAQTVGIILSTLGRQGSIGILESLQRLLEDRGIASFTILMGEILPYKLKGFTNVEAFIQIGCPRLSIDWGHFYSTPLLTPYECHVAFSNIPYKEVYPMDYYSKDGGIWTNYGTGGHRSGSLAPVTTVNGKFDRVASRRKMEKHLPVQTRVTVAYELTN